MRKIEKEIERKRKIKREREIKREIERGLGQFNFLKNRKFNSKICEMFEKF